MKFWHMDESWKNDAKWKDPDMKDRHCMIPLIWVSQNGEIHGDGKALRVWEKEEGKLLFNGPGISIGDNEKVLEIDSCDDYTMLWVYLMPLNGTLKYG